MPGLATSFAACPVDTRFLRCLYRCLADFCGNVDWNIKDLRNALKVERPDHYQNMNEQLDSRESFQHLIELVPAFAGLFDSQLGEQNFNPRTNEYSDVRSQDSKITLVPIPLAYINPNSHYNNEVSFQECFENVLLADQLNVPYGYNEEDPKRRPENINNKNFKYDNVTYPIPTTTLKKTFIPNNSAYLAFTTGILHQVVQGGVLKDVKSFTNVEFPIKMKFGDSRYTIHVLIVQIGPSLNGGHYYVLIRIKGVWFLFSDDDVPIRLDDSTFRKAYRDDLLAQPYIALYKNDSVGDVLVF